MVHEPHTVGERLAFVRQAHGLTWGATAQLLGVAPGDVAGYEQGQEAPLAVLVTFCDVFAVRWYWLVEGRGASAKPPMAGNESAGAPPW